MSEGKQATPKDVLLWRARGCREKLNLSASLCFFATLAGTIPKLGVSAILSSLLLAHHFVSHASDDNLLIAKPLAHILQEAKFKVWKGRCKAFSYISR